MSDIVGDPGVATGSRNTPDVVKSPQGALLLYSGVMSLQASTVASYIVTTGMFTDELQWSGLGNGLRTVDSRILPEGTPYESPLGTDNNIGNVNFLYTALNKVRVNAQQARAIFAQYYPGAPNALRGHLYAMEGMADVLLAEAYCSGIPLSTVDADANMTLRPGSSTEDVFRAAVTLFDSAITLAQDSSRILNFARMGKARAQLGLEDYAAAATTVADVPTDYRYLLEFGPSSAKLDNGFTRSSATGLYTGNSMQFSIGTSEGVNGLPYATWGDWRTDTVPVNITQPGGVNARVRVATKYATTGTTSIILASGLEARLIEAEANFRSGGSQWLTTLSDLRANCKATTTCSPLLVTPSQSDTLTALTDPGTDSARKVLLFKERAAWLYLTGHRQGDMRRLVRDGWPQELVYPSGLYFGGVTAAGQVPPPHDYGNEVNFPVPPDEQENNKLYAGCINREA